MGQFLFAFSKNLWVGVGGQFSVMITVLKIFVRFTVKYQWQIIIFFSKFLAECWFNFSSVDVEFKWPASFASLFKHIILNRIKPNVPYYTNIKRYINLCDFDSLNVNLCTRFFISNRVAQGIKNGLKVRQLAKQPPTLKTLMQKILFGLWVRNFNFSILSSLKLNFSHNCFWHNLIVYNNI